jgi:(1->4)-alpha-D-glucan 1-alpha-D-glucosylmutase
LARLVLHVTSPGTPDIYQGDEFWNYALVDPDNRRQIDYDARTRALGELTSTSARLRGDSAVDLYDNHVKLLVTQRVLDFRRSHADLFTRGAYQRLVARGPRAGHVVSFARSFGELACVTVVARFTAKQLGVTPDDWWADTSVEVPAELDSTRWHSVISGENVDVAAGTFRVGALLAKLPSAVVAN